MGSLSRDDAGQDARPQGYLAAGSGQRTVGETSRGGSFLERAGAWFWCAALLGIAARLTLAWTSGGTSDVMLWTQHAAGVSREGLSLHYTLASQFNHPPPIAWLMARVWEWTHDSKVSFASAYRTLVALADVGSAALLWFVLRGFSRRALCVASYLLAPVALALAGQHGNTDAMIGTCLLACILCLGHGRIALAGALLGLSSWIKLPGLLVAPAIAFTLPCRRAWLTFGGVAMLVASLGFVPSFLAAEHFANQHAGEFPLELNMMVERVFGYHGLYIRTSGHPPTFIFGLKNLLFRVFGHDPGHWPRLALWWLDLRAWPTVDRSRWVAYTAMLVLGFLRRRERATVEIGATLALSYALFYGLVETCTFQYFAWSMALWMLLPPMAALVTHVVGGGFVYATYAYLCRDPWLIKPWDFAGHANWPAWLTVWRDAANLTFLLLGALALTNALRCFANPRQRPGKVSEAH